MITKILFATDGLPPAKAAGELMERLVVPDRVEVSILHAVHAFEGQTPTQQAQSIVDEAQQDLMDAGIRCDVRIERGDPDFVIEKALAAEDFGLVVAGAGKHPWYERFVFGTVSTHLLNNIAVPLLVAHRLAGGTTGPVRAVVGVDGSASADHALHTLTSITDPEHCSIEVRSVVEMPVIPATGHAAAYVPVAEVQRLIDDRRGAAEACVEHAVQRLRDDGFRAARSIADGSAAIDLVEHATHVGADLVVVGARGLGPIGRLTVGSVSAHVARHAAAALVVRLPHGFAGG